MSWVSDVQQALCVSIARICADTAPGAPKPQAVRDTKRELFPSKHAHSIQKLDLEVIELPTDSEDEHGPQTPAAADVYDTPMIPLKQAAQGKRKIEWSPHPSDVSEQQDEQGTLRTEGEEVNGRSGPSQACLGVRSHDKPRAAANVAQQLPHVDLAPACPQITQQPRPSQHPGSAHPMHASYADTASGSSSQGQPSRQKTAQKKGAQPSCYETAL